MMQTVDFNKRTASVTELDIIKERLDVPMMIDYTEFPDTVRHILGDKS